jgi:hypothetical protein
MPFRAAPVFANLVRLPASPFGDLPETASSGELPLYWLEDSICPAFAPILSQAVRKG